MKGSKKNIDVFEGIQRELQTIRKRLKLNHKINSKEFSKKLKDMGVNFSHD